jgi:hypothetical protein
VSSPSWTRQNNGVAGSTVILGGGGWLNVKEFGALGNNSANDTDAIQDAIEQAEANGGGTVFFPEGTYKVTTLSVVGQNVTLLGDNAAVIKGTSDAAWVIHFNGAGSLKYSNALRHLIVGHTTGTQGATYGAVKFEDQAQFFVEDLSLNPAGTATATALGLYLDNGSQGTISDCKLVNCRGDAFTNYQSANTYGYNVFVGGLADGFVFDGTDGAFLDNWQAYQCQGKGFLFQKTTASVNANIFLSNCISDSNLNHNWHISSASFVFMDNCWGATNYDTTTDATATGITLDSTATDIYFTNCVFAQNNKYGMSIEGSSNVSIVGGTVQSNSRTAANSVAGINISGAAANVSITGVRCTDQMDPKKQTYGIGVANTATFVTITGCNLTGNLTGAINDTATASANRFYSKNLGYNPRTVTTPAVPATTVVETNTTNVDVMVYLAGGTLTAGTEVNGVATLGTTDIGYFVPAGGTIKLTYSAAPTWVWVGT